MTLLEPGAVAPPTDDQIQEILVWLSARPRSTGEIARKFCLTPAQVRAGLEPLRAQGALRRTAGGAWEEVEGADGTPSQISISDLEDPPDPSSDSTPIPSNPPPIPLDSPAAEPAQEPPMAVDPTPDHLAPSDRRVLDLVRAQPGVAQAAVADLTGISGGTVAGCVRRLEGRGLIERRREAPTERPGYLGLALYPAGAPASPTPPAPPPKKAAEVRRDTLALIRAEPGILQAQAGQRIGVNQSATSRALRELEAEGLIRREEIEIPREGGGGTRSLALYPVGQAASEPAPPPETRLPPLVRPRPEKLLATPPAESAALPDLRPISEYLEPPGIDSCPEQVPRLDRPPGPWPDCDGSDPEDRDAARAGLAWRGYRIGGDLLDAIGEAVAQIDDPMGGLLSGPPPEGWPAAIRDRVRVLRAEIAAAQAAARQAAEALDANDRGAPTWDGSRLIALRPVELGQVSQDEDDLWTWEAETEDGPESGEAPTEARARARVEQAAGVGA